MHAGAGWSVHLWTGGSQMPEFVYSPQWNPLCGDARPLIFIVPDLNNILPSTAHIRIAWPQSHVGEDWNVRGVMSQFGGVNVGIIVLIKRYKTASDRVLQPNGECICGDVIKWWWSVMMNGVIIFDIFLAAIEDAARRLQMFKNGPAFSVHPYIDVTLICNAAF